MRRFWLLVAFFPSLALAAASLSGVDDIDPNIPVETRQKIDDAIFTYYQHPSVAKVNTVLDIMNNTDLLRKKTSWSPLVGFLTIVFANNKNHVMDWISRNDYNTHAEDVFVNALLDAGLKESALVFAQAHQWKRDDLERIREHEGALDLKHLTIVLPGHIDTLWGAFFASGDTVYINEIIDVLFMAELPEQTRVVVPLDKDVLGENKQLARYTLKEYAHDHPKVRDAIGRRIKHEKDAVRKELLKQLMP